jgi:DNA-binding CsgD family transcriptional regulator/GAF domain-containing protein
VKSDEDLLIDRFYDAIAAPDRWQEALEAVRKSFGAAGAVIGFFDPMLPHLSLGLGSGVWDADLSLQYLRDFAAIDPVPAKLMRERFGDAISSMELMPAEETRNCVFYNEFYRPIGLVETLGAKLVQDSKCFGVIGLHRDVKREEFDQADAAKIERLIPHISRAVSLRQAFGRLQIEARSLGASIDKLRHGVIVYDRLARCLHVNTAAQGFIGRKDGLALARNGRLRAADRASDRVLGQLQASVPTGASGGLAHVARTGAGRPYVVLVAPLPAGAGLIGAVDEGRVGVLILIHDPDAMGRPLADMLAEIFGLTQRAAELTAALVAGEDLKDFAERAGLTSHTVRFHLKVAFSRLGVHSQAELVRLAVRALAELHL